MTVSYVFDVYRRQISPEPSLLNFAVFVAYFPHLVAGPILRAGLLLPQIAHPRRIARAQITDGLWLMAWGLFGETLTAQAIAGMVLIAAGVALGRGRAPPDR